MCCLSTKYKRRVLRVTWRATLYEMCCRPLLAGSYSLDGENKMERDTFETYRPSTRKSAPKKEGKNPIKIAEKSKHPSGCVSPPEVELTKINRHLSLSLFFPFILWYGRRVKVRRWMLRKRNCLFMLCTIRIERALRMPSTPKGIGSEMKEREKYLIFNSKKEKKKKEFAVSFSLLLALSAQSDWIKWLFQKRTTC